jgi:hypothetical protein
MRRLQVLPCPEPWERMQPDGDGRFCERCSLRVTEVAKLDTEDLEQLIAAAEGGRVCVRFELEGGRPRTKLGLAAGLVVIALASCATPDSLGTEAPIIEEAPLVELIDDGSDLDGSGSVIAGAVHSMEGFPLANALVVLQSAALEAPQERMTNEHGIYKFKHLPPGNYTIQVLYNKANVSKVTTLPENVRFRANFKIDPDYALDGMLVGVLSEESMLDTTSPASTYSSSTTEYE